MFSDVVSRIDNVITLQCNLGKLLKSICVFSIDKRTLYSHIPNFDNPANNVIILDKSNDFPLYISGSQNGYPLIIQTNTKFWWESQQIWRIAELSRDK